MRYPEKTIRSLPDLLRSLPSRGRGSEQVWFRGQARASWKLRPSLARNPSNLDQELTLLKRFKQNAFLLLTHRPQEEWEWLFIMQHHGVPTRLLDWTESALIALYFAVAEKPKSPGALWALLPLDLNRVANVGVPSHAPATDIPAFDEDSFLSSYLPSALASELTSTLSTIALLAPRNTARSQAQLATFTITHRNLTPIEALSDGRHIWRYIIPAAAKDKIRRELERLHIRKLTLFPELANVGSHAKEILA